MKRLMDLSEVIEICKDRTMWKFIVSAYPSGKYTCANDGGVARQRIRKTRIARRLGDARKAPLARAGAGVVRLECARIKTLSLFFGAAAPSRSRLLPSRTARSGRIRRRDSLYRALEFGRATAARARDGQMYRRIEDGAPFVTAGAASHYDVKRGEFKVSGGNGTAPLRPRALRAGPPRAARRAAGGDFDGNSKVVREYVPAKVFIRGRQERPRSEVSLNHDNAFTQFSSPAAEGLAGGWRGAAGAAADVLLTV
ncbi:hypothetical protein EVAR_102779_1 [Eumeta japonica]|uniref:Uncharacterized protein n=1 Tax=Eumeta variegata TaxID=151549 RepID=A0A4C1TKX9_EUMVA|nr:hypothetical protein EVAR_102779_1 [Eumeta japonica]